MAIEKKIKVFWTLILIAGGLGLLVLQHFYTNSFELHILPIQAGMVLFFLAFLCGYIDSSLGMGYGTTLTPVLLILAFPRAEVVPAVLLSQLVSGAVAALGHHKLGNVDFIADPSIRRVLLVLSLPSLLVAISAVWLGSVLDAMNRDILKIYIALMVMGIGFWLLYKQFRVRTKHAPSFSGRRIILLGVFAAFNKGVSAGGYGPLVTGGQLLSGVSEKKAVAITTLSEVIVSLAGVLGFILFFQELNWFLVLFLTTGATLSVPFATLTVKYMPKGILTSRIAYATLFLGGVSLYRFLPQLLN